MKSTEFITEAVTPKLNAIQLALNIRAECSEYLNLLRGSTKLLYRGIDSSLPTCGQKFKFRKRNGPRDTSPVLSKFIDTWFLANFGRAYRIDSTFATGNATSASEYGATCAIFPVNGFTYCWGKKIKDLTFDLLRKMPDSPDLTYMPNNKQDAELRRQQIIIALNKAGYTETGLQDAIRLNKEVMLYCPNGYYLVNLDYDEYKSIIALIFSNDIQSDIDIFSAAVTKKIGVLQKEKNKLTATLQSINKHEGNVYFWAAEELRMVDTQIVKLQANLWTPK